MAYRRRPAQETPWTVASRRRHWSTPSVPIPPPPPELPRLPDFPAFEFPALEFPPPFDPEAAETTRRQREERKAVRTIEAKRKGYARTLLTSGEGVTEEPDVRRPMLRGR